MSEIVTTERHYPSPPEAVFAAWRDLNTLTRWWGCAPETLWRVHTWDFGVGGEIHVSQTFGTEDYEVRGDFVEIDEPSRIVFTWEHDQVITVTIKPDESGSIMRVDHAGLDSAMHPIVTGGWAASFDHITEALT
ncbi:MAG: SRPBCC family protein [Actinomycetota bacterium]